jgi:hypothetical protein
MWSNGTYKYVKAHEVLKYDDAYIELLEEIEFTNKQELYAREGHHIRTMECVNKCITGRTNKEYCEEYKKIHIDEIKEYQQKYRDEHNEESKEYMKKYQEDNKDKMKEYRKQYYLQNKIKLTEQNKKYQEEHKKEIKEYHKKYYEETKN